MNQISLRLRELGITIPSVPAPRASYVPATRAGTLIFTAGQLAFVDGELKYPGQVGGDVSVLEAQQAARLCALNALAAVHALVGLDSITSVVRVTGYVVGGPGFSDSHVVINGASDLVSDIFGTSGDHARSAVGVSSLPFNASVKVELIAETSAALTR